MLLRKHKQAKIMGPTLTQWLVAPQQNITAATGSSAKRHTNSTQRSINQSNRGSLLSTASWWKRKCQHWKGWKVFSTTQQCPWCERSIKQSPSRTTHTSRTKGVKKLNWLTAIPKGDCSISKGANQSGSHRQTSTPYANQSTNHAIQVCSSSQSLLIKQRRSQRQPQNHMEELAQAVLDNNLKCAAVEYANEIFDEDLGKLMKYSQLITHLKYDE